MHAKCIVTFYTVLLYIALQVGEGTGAELECSQVLPKRAGDPLAPDFSAQRSHWAQQKHSNSRFHSFMRKVTQVFHELLEIFGD